MSEALPVPDAALPAEHAPVDVEQTLRRVADLEALLRERDDLLALAAHELRNPLHGLTLQLALLRSTAEAEGAAQAVDRVSKAQRMLSRYADRVTLLLELVSLNASAYPLSHKAVDLSAALAGVVDAVAPEARARAIRIDVCLPEHCIVQTDAIVVGQMVDNLLLNACKHSGGSQVNLKLHLDDDWVHIEVSDDGRGVAAEDVERIFDKFGVARVRERGGGSGLGLWIVRRLVTALGGRIDVVGAPGNGACFRLTFPSSLAPPEHGT